MHWENLVKNLSNCGFTHALPDLVFLAAFLGLVIYAVISDVRGFHIPNAVSYALIALFFVRLLFISPQAGVSAHLLTAALAFSVLFAIYLLGPFSAGDVKLISAIVLWTGPSAAQQFIVALAAAGVIFGVFLLALSRLLRAYAGLAAYVPSSRLRRWAQRGVCPYGVPILAAVVLNCPLLLEDAVCKPL